ncbi:glycerol-3-phosphate ABC transporter ATP-binding protein [Halobacteriales archaeon QH_6_64_20]|nr:MAG: glycerol-3-phosphate ABC transporter ATP-binding protein [Halobacteriales archaeon QH_6_64_20]
MSDTKQRTEAPVEEAIPGETEGEQDINVRIDSLRKVFQDNEKGEVVAVDGISIDVHRDEFLVLVGPSGCGKTTTLRSVAGLETPTDGRIIIENEDVTGLDPRERDISMVFQNYALYPHKKVRENLSFPLEVRSYPKDEIDSRVEHTAELLDIPELLERKPSALSGGQQQRVALGRAIVREPAVFLMDEPLSNLDAKLRVQMRTELNDLHKRVGKTTIYVTHDQAEAMTLGDRVAVMNNGDVTVRKEGNGHVAESDVFEIGLSSDLAADVEEWDGDLDDLTLGLRPEDIHDVEMANELVEETNTFDAYVRLIEPMGSDKFLTLTPTDAAAADAGGEFSARISPDSPIEEDEVVTLVANTEKLHLFDNRTGENVSF